MPRLTIMVAVLSIVHGCSLGSSRVQTATPAAPQGAAEKAAAVGAAGKATIAVACDGRVPGRLPKHVLLIVLENEDYETTFGETTPPSYLKELAGQGVLLSKYYGIGHNSLDNYIAMISGQAPNKLTQLDCPVFVDFFEMDDNEEAKSQAKLKTWARAVHDLVERDDEARDAAEHQQPLGIGCVYPAHVLTVADQLERSSPPLTWAAYMEGMPAKCTHPKIGQPDDTRNRPSNTKRYAVRHNPFAYFHSLLDSKSCDKHDKPLGRSDGSTDGLVRDLQAKQSPALMFISPDLCNDGHDDCDGTGAAGKLARIDAFLRQWVPIIQSSTAYRDDGMIIITFDEAEVARGVDEQTLQKNRRASVRCCNEQPGPFADDPGIFGPGGGRVGAVILSPLVDPGTKHTHDFHHYSLLSSIEDMFRLEHLGFAGAKDLRTFQECGVFKPDPPTSPDAQHL